MEVKKGFWGTDRLTQHHRGKRELPAHLIRSCPDDGHKKYQTKGHPEKVRTEHTKGFSLVVLNKTGKEQ